MTRGRGLGVVGGGRNGDREGGGGGLGGDWEGIGGWVSLVGL